LNVCCGTQVRHGRDPGVRIRVGCILSAMAEAGAMDDRADRAAQTLRAAGASFALIFGSRARGTARPGSDLDVAALWSGKPPEPWDIEMPQGVDLVILHFAVCIIPALFQSFLFLPQVQEQCYH